MKSLLAYLFIVLGLGLLSNAYANHWNKKGGYVPPGHFAYCVKVENDYSNRHPGQFVYEEGKKYIVSFKHAERAGYFTFNRSENICDEQRRKNYNEITIFVNSKNMPWIYKELEDAKKDGAGVYFDLEWTPRFKKLIKEKYSKNSEEPDTSSADKAKIEEEKKKIAEEKRKIEEEKRKITEAKKKQEEEEKKRKEANAKLYVIGSGTGFFVNSSGYAASNEHVVGACREVATKIKGEIIKFKIIATDIPNDIGLIKTDFNNINYLNINPSGADIGEDIVAFGYPLSDKLSSSVKLTRGIVSSLSGPGNNYSLIQIDAAIQPGNSGGPVLNYNSQVVGIASAGLKKVKMLIEQEFIPENVNFAVAASSLSNFLKANNVIIGSEEIKVNNTKELAKIGIPATIQLYCLNTKAAHKKNKENKRYGDVMLEKVMDLK